ncbi:phage tail tape measure protein [Bradyrhizobium sp. SZCCHNR1039]|uniref:phage tail tape measure protein n=1 Tax=Bradyrhizobium sp. SZCCHNR1039 TaxID=3057350 RepID=UPI002916EC78|nr:phage tail tape measure protein [Bradyrhizobium sp. SZCCHNR1039]
MSETLNVRATFTTTNELSPTIRRIIADIKRLESVSKSFSASFSNVGRAGMESMAGFSRVAQNAAAQMRGLSNTSKAASRSYSADWRRATDQRLSDARKMYAQLDVMESRYQRQLERRVAAERRAERNAGRAFGGVGGSGVVGRLPRLSTITLGGGVIGASAASAIKQRMSVEAAEVRAQMFGELSKDEVEALRKSFADRAGIRFGIGTSKALDVVTEGLKAGIAKQFAGDFGELALKAQAGLDIPSADVAKLLGRLSTQMPWNKDRFGKILNAVAVANNATAADGSEIVEAMRRSLSALATTKMTPEQLAALDSTAISLGIQPFKAGTFLSFLTSQVAGADSAHGQQAKDLNSAANALGFGGRTAMANAMRSNPVQAIQQMLDNLASMPEKLRNKVAKQIGGREWMDELLTLVLGRDKLKDVLREVETKQGFLDSSYLKKTRSMQGRWATISAAFSLAWEKIGAGFESIFDQISDAVIELASSFNFDTVKDHFAALIDGFREGFGLKNWGEVVRSLAESFDAGPVKKWRSFGKGFAEGVMEIAGGLNTAFKVLSFIFGGGKDAEGLGKFVAKLTGLAVALALLSPTLSALALFTGLITTLATMNPFARLALGFIALAVGIKKVLDYVSDRIFSVFVHIVDAVKGAALAVINKVRGWIGLAPIGGGSHGASGSWEDGTSGSVQRQSFLGPSNEAAASFQKASYSGGGIDRSGIPSFNGSGGSAGGLDRAAFERKFAGTSLAGKYDQIVAAAKANNIDPALLAGVIAHETGNGQVLSGNNPGGIMDPATGMSRKMQFADLDTGINKTAQMVAKNYRRAGGDLDKMGAIYAPPGAANDPRGLNGGWPSGVRKQMNAMAGGVAAGVQSGLADQLGIRGGANFMRGQYGSPGQNLTTIMTASGKKLTVNAAAAESFRGFVDELEASGYKVNSLGGFSMRGKRMGGGWSQHAYGNAIDINPDQNKQDGTGRTTMPANVRDMAAKYGLSWGGDWSRRYNDPMHFEWMGKKPWLDNVPSPTDAVKNVPPSRIPDAGIGGGRSASGNVAIHINGNSHDPEALATLVQRRVDESMNWRAHDSESEYT